MYIKTIQNVYKLTVQPASRSKLFKPRAKLFYFESETDAVVYAANNFANSEFNIEKTHAFEDQGEWREVHDVIKYEKAVHPTVGQYIPDSALSGILQLKENERSNRIILIGVKPNGDISLIPSDYSHDAKFYIRTNPYIVNGIWHSEFSPILVKIDRHTFTFTTPEANKEFVPAYEAPIEHPQPSAPPLKLL